MKIEQIDDLMDMEIHEIKEVGIGWRVMRVLGGWIYEAYGDNEELGLSYVPEPQHLISRDKPCKIYGHRFQHLSKKAEKVREINKISPDDNGIYWMCDKCGELTKSV